MAQHTFEVSRPPVQVPCGDPRIVPPCAERHLYAHFIPGPDITYRVDGQVVSEAQFNCIEAAVRAEEQSPKKPGTLLGFPIIEDPSLPAGEIQLRDCILAPVHVKVGEKAAGVSFEKCPPEGLEFEPNEDPGYLKVTVAEGQRYRVRAHGEDAGPWQDGPAVVRIDRPSVLEVQENRPVAERGPGIAGALVQEQVCPDGHGPLRGYPTCVVCGRAPVYGRRA